MTIGTGAGGDVENVLFSDIVVQTRLFSPNWWGSGEAIFVRAAPWHDEVGRIRHARFRNVLARGESGAVIFGAFPGLVRDVTLDGVRLELERTTPWPARRDLRPYADGGPHEVPLPGILIDQADAVGLIECEIAYVGERRDDFGPMISVRAATDLRIDGLRGEPARAGLERIQYVQATAPTG